MMRIAPYILAGGRSSRMGRDKAMIELGGKTMLRRAVETLRSVKSLVCAESKATVTVIGERTLLEGADRSITDRYPGCGPLGGIEAALGDLMQTDAADWALFVPVDMPFLPARLIDALLHEWGEGAALGARVCHVVVDDRPQPLVSLIHREVHEGIQQALQAGEYRVTPVLQSACAAIASQHAETLRFTGSSLWQTTFTAGHTCALDGTWSATESEAWTRHLWFANLNTMQELHEAETFLFKQGSMSKLAGSADMYLLPTEITGNGDREDPIPPVR